MNAEKIVNTAVTLINKHNYENCVLNLKLPSYAVQWLVLSTEQWPGQLRHKTI